MAKHEVIIHENTSPTKTTAPYLGNYVSKSTVELKAACDEIATYTGLPAIQVRAILEGAFNYASRWQRDGLVRLHVDGGTVGAMISGMFPTADAAFNPDVNKFLVRFYPDADIRNALVNEVPTIVTDETLTKVKLNHVVDDEEPRPYEVIHGEHPFEIQGYNLIMTDEGAGVELVNKDGVTFPVTVVEAVSKQVLRCKSAALLAAGDYKLVVKSRGGEVDGPLQVTFRKIKYLHVVDPDPVITGAAGTGADGKIKNTDTVTVTGTNLRIPTGGAIKLVMLGSGGAEYVALADVTINAAKTQLTGTVTDIDPQGDDGSISIVDAADELVSNEFSVSYQRS